MDKYPKNKFEINRRTERHSKQQLTTLKIEKSRQNDIHHTKVKSPTHLTKGKTRTADHTHIIHTSVINHLKIKQEIPT